MCNFSVYQTVFILTVLFSSCFMAVLRSRMSIFDRQSFDNYLEVYRVNDYVSTTRVYNNPSTENYTTDSDVRQYNVTTKGYFFDYADTDTENISNTILPSTELIKSEEDYARWEQEISSGHSCPTNATCVRKCCPFGFTYNLSMNTCVETVKGRSLQDLVMELGLGNLMAVAEHFKCLYGKIKCRTYLGEVRKLVTEISPFFYILESGSLYVENAGAALTELELGINKYCIDLFITANGTTEKNAFICYEYENDRRMHYLLSGICMLVTCFLVLLRVFVFAWVPEFQTLHGIILMAYLISFLAGFLLLGLEEFLVMDRAIGESYCVTLSLIIYFSILSAFFWRNVMCYDIWWTFRGIRTMSGRGSSSRTRFRLYGAYAFGGPMVLTIVLCSIEFSGISDEYWLMPRLKINCFLMGYGRLFYFLGPILTLFVMNMIFFILTALKIAAIKKQNKIILTNEDSCSQKLDTRQFKIYVKLFASMAFLEVNLILEMITILKLNNDTVDILHITDTFNVLAPLIIIVNTLCRRQTWRMIKKRYRQRRGLPMSQVQSVERTVNSDLRQEDCDSTVTHQ